MLSRLCQLKSLTLSLLLILGSCAWKAKEEASEILRKTNPQWFSVSTKHSLQNLDEKPLSHLFYDATPDFNQTLQKVNVVIATPQNSDYGYMIDLSSGQRHFTHA